MKKIVLVITILFLFTIATLFTQETTPETDSLTDTEIETTNTPAASKEEQYYRVEGLENWHYDFDISDYPEGKYNIIIKGTDFAGNEYIEGPFDIQIDPESEL